MLKTIVTSFAAFLAIVNQAQAASILETVVASDVHTTLETVVLLDDYKPILDFLSTATEGTLFAPTDTAFAAAGIDVTNVEAVTNVLLYHALATTKNAETLLSEFASTTVLGQDVKVQEGETAVVVNHVDVTASIVCDNGIIHVIDQVLLPPGNIAEVASGVADLSTLLAVLGDADFKPVLDALLAVEAATVFAPNNEAFASAGIDLAYAKANVEAVSQVLYYHVIGSKVYSPLLADGTDIIVPTVQTQNIQVKQIGGVVTVNSATVSSADFLATNTVIHVIDSVLSIPQASIVDIVVASEDHTTLETVLTSADFKPVLDAVAGLTEGTLFAPTDAAFAAANINVTNVEAVTNVLLYHVIAATKTAGALLGDYAITTALGQDVIVKTDGNQVVVNTSPVTATVLASNGIVHVVDTLLLPPSNIGAVAAGVPVLSTLLAVLLEPEFKPVLDALLAAEALTVFAPTNEAFAAANVDLVFAKANVEAVTKILQYHVVPSKVYANLLDNPTDVDVATLQGSTVNVVKNNDGVKVNDAVVAVADVLADNTVVHVISSVLTPPEETPADNPDGASSASSLTVSTFIMLGSALLAFVM